MTTSVLGLFSVDEQPSEPLLITVTDKAGNAVDLATYSAVTIESDGLPAGTTSIADPALGVVQYDFSAPFLTAGVISARVKMTTVSGAVDYSAWFFVQVADSTSSGLIVDQAYVEATTASTVTKAAIAKAQSQVGLFIDRDLADTTWWARIHLWDQRRLKNAVAWQAAQNQDEANGNTLLPQKIPYGIQAMATGGNSVTFRADYDPSGMAPLALIAIKALSWRRRLFVRSAPSRPNARYRTMSDPVFPEEWQAL